ncbi:hypothetical protein [Streptomyces lavendulae]|uniref:hypothetical protein n=1 Tax=Streptomyces lavendulae TaxID=1914 RepID=UPI000A556A4B|nr:hypothetical protein [Streptomyces lavendulae]
MALAAAALLMIVLTVVFDAVVRQRLQQRAPRPASWRCPMTTRSTPASGPRRPGWSHG